MLKLALRNASLKIWGCAFYRTRQAQVERWGFDCFIGMPRVLLGGPFPQYIHSLGFEGEPVVSRLSTLNLKRVLKSSSKSGKILFKQNIIHMAQQKSTQDSFCWEDSFPEPGHLWISMNIGGTKSKVRFWFRVGRPTAEIETAEEHRAFLAGLRGFTRLGGKKGGGDTLTGGWPWLRWDPDSVTIKSGPPQGAIEISRGMTLLVAMLVELLVFSPGAFLLAS